MKGGSREAYVRTGAGLGAGAGAVMGGAAGGLGAGAGAVIGAALGAKAASNRIAGLLIATNSQIQTCELSKVATPPFIRRNHLGPLDAHILEEIFSGGCPL